MPTDDELQAETARRYPASWEDRGRTDRDDERDAFVEGYEAGVAAERERCARIVMEQAEVDAPSSRAIYAVLAAAIRADREPEPSWDAVEVATVEQAAQMQDAGREPEPATEAGVPTRCTASHTLLEGGARCHRLAGHESAGIPHITVNGTWWYDEPETDWLFDPSTNQRIGG